ncbi:MAG TPA: hypothetical protein ENK47_03935 [Euryarchaeota archaeon]|nr:hypothetical protein [Euryarchaeota archaeon]
MVLSEERMIRFSRYGMVPYNWIVEGELLASVYPVEVEYLLHLRDEEGIGSAVNLSEYPWPVEWTRITGIECVHFPVPDMGVPTSDDASRIIDFIISSSRLVMVHCAAGIGRTGTIAALYLVEKGMGAGDAIATVRRRRPGSIQTREQEKLVFRWDEMRRK